MNADSTPFEPISTGRCLVERNGSGIRITVPPRPPQKSYFVIGFLSFWLIGWAVGWCAGVNWLLGVVGLYPFGPPPATSPAPTTGGIVFLVIWFVFWTCVGGGIITLMLGMLFGVQILEIDGSGVTDKYQILRWKRVKRYSSDAISNARATTTWTQDGRTSMTNLAFDYGSKTVRTLNGVEGTEIRHLLQQIEQAVPGWEQKVGNGMR